MLRRGWSRRRKRERSCLGKQTVRLTHRYVDVTPVEPLTLRGKSLPVAAFRLAGVRPRRGLGRQLDAPMVGRQVELPQLRLVLDDVIEVSRLPHVHDRRDAGCRQVTPHSRVARFAERRHGAARPMPVLRGGHHLLADHRSGQTARGAAAHVSGWTRRSKLSSRSSCGCHRCLDRRDRLGVSPAVGGARGESQWCWCLMTSSGVRRPFLTW